MRAVLEGPHPTRGVWLLVGLSGMVEALANAVINVPIILAFVGRIKTLPELREHTTTILIFLGILAVGGMLFGCLRLWLGSIFLSWTGRWVDGNATRQQIMPAIAWPQIIFIPANLLLAVPASLLLLGVLDLEAFEVWMPLGSLLGITGFIWAGVVYLKCLGEAQGFSAWMALANTILAGLMGVVLIILPLGILAVVIVPTLLNLFL